MGSLRGAALLFGLLTACASRLPSAERDVAPVAATPPAPAPPASVSKPAGAPEQRDSVLLVTDPVVLKALEPKGYGLGDLLDGAPARDNETLERSPGYASIARVLERDVAAVALGDPLAGTSVARHSHRLFNARWLRSAALRFELIGVVNRLDRRPFHGGACGEVRLVYRLAYTLEREGTAPLASRLPLTIGLEFPLPPPDARGSCAGEVARWRPLAGLSGDSLASFLSSPEGPLAGAARTDNQGLQVAVNLQVVRWPSTIRPDLAGHAEYVLRAFRRRGSDRSFDAAPLENTPDVARLSGQPALRGELLAWIRDAQNLARIDEGTALVPERFLARADVSVTPRGLNRRANRPYRRLFKAGDFADLDLGQRRFARSPEALIRRLDQLTCSGCHQARTIAGFHLLGSDDPGTPALNSLREPVSVHVAQDLERRARVVDALATGGTPDYAQPLAERADPADGAFGAHCGLGDPGFASWTCNAGLRCDPYDAEKGDSTVGVCLPAEPGEVGDACALGAMVPNDSARRDRAGGSVSRTCRASACQGNSVGFPGGMCSAGCAGAPAEAACGAIAILEPFNACIARREPFASCIESHHRPAALRRCSARAACRDDYVCARSAQGDGVCIPPYFVFQLRVDGHPL